MVYYGGDQHCLDYYDSLDKDINIASSGSFGPVCKLFITPDQHSLIAVTENGIILSYSIIRSKKLTDS